MTKKNKVAIVLGGTKPHIKLIESLKNRSFFTVLVDYYENPPAKEYADKHIQESTLDREKVLQIAKDWNADLVISCCIDRVISICSSISQELGLNFPLSYETSLVLTNKMLMKKMMLENDIPTGKFHVLKNTDDIKHIDIKLPVILKPVDGEGSLGIFYIQNIDDFKTKFIETLEISKTKTALVEEFYNGIEIQADFFIRDQIPVLLLTRRKIKRITPEGRFISLGSLIPYQLTENIQVEIKNIVKKIVDLLNINNTPFLIQFIIDDDAIKIIEFTARVGGQLSYQIIKHQTGIDIIDNFVSGVLQENIPLTIDRTNNVMITAILHTQKGVFNKVDNYQRFIESNELFSLDLYRTSGMELDGSLTAKSRVGIISSVGENNDRVFKTISKILDTMRVYDTNGNDILNREILIQENDIN